MTGIQTNRQIIPNSVAPFQIATGSGAVRGIRTFNINTAPRYLKFYDSVAAPTVGTTPPLDVVGIPGNTSGGGNNSSTPIGPAYQNGLWAVVTTGILDSDTTAPTASQVLTTILYG